LRLVISNGTRGWGGLEQMTVLLARGFQRRGHDVLVFCRKGSVVHERLQGAVACAPILRGDRMNPITQGRCAHALVRHRAQAVIGNTTKEPAWTGIPARLLGIPFVYRHEFSRPYPAGKLYEFLYGRVTNLHVVNSRSSRETLLEADWLAPERVRVVPNGIETEVIEAAATAALGLPTGALAFGFVGRLEEEKGIWELAQAWPQVVRTIPGAHLVLVGWGPLEEAIRAVLGGAPNVHFFGFRNDVPSLMKAFDVLVAPFHKEGFGLVLVEAMTAGVPVVASRSGAIPELIEDGVEGKLVPVRDGAALAAAMIGLGQDAELRKRMGAAGRARARRDFSWERMIQGHEALLEELIAQRRASARPR
jgi:glycosyltransferase involved in cell wall biosynthesis